MIVRKGQIVYWQGSNVTVYEVDGEGREQIRKLVGSLMDKVLFQRGSNYTSPRER